ncbi:hypothetical protein FIBSPDRAFT_1011584 [Athelia psychrophila]|uniref:Uncharacterized protein n=1 Tax=Athelia psychrophila TaxID=1759441 RepID=A0A166MW85_9AGAM|nr:hypothetical protein FIBSPDRAFT_1011584 [Fibularhizoctonia sp. CBS 109695]
MSYWTMSYLTYCQDHFKPIKAGLIFPVHYNKVQGKVPNQLASVDAKELRWITIAMYTSRDTNAVFADDVSWFMSPSASLTSQRDHKAPTYAQATVSSPALDTLRICSPATSSSQTVFRSRLARILLDGGGGRRIRAIRAEEDIEEAFKRREPDRPTVFRDGAIWTGMEAYRGQDRGQCHGDVAICANYSAACNGGYRRSLRWRPPPPFTIRRYLANLVLAASKKMAHALRYQGVGSFQYLVNSLTAEWIQIQNPKYPMMYLTDKRITVITEELMNLDIMRIQLLLSSATLASLDLISASINLPQVCPMQSGLTAEDLAKDFRLSAGTIPAQLCPGPWDMESLCADEISARAVRALREKSLGTRMSEVKTNRAVFTGVVAHTDEEEGKYNTMWLQRELEDATRIGTVVLEPRVGGFGFKGQPCAEEVAVNSLAMQPGAISHLVVSSSGSKATSAAKKHTLTLASTAHNDFPTNLSGTLQSIFSASPLMFLLKQAQSSAGVQAGAFDLADSNDSTQVAAALTGNIWGGSGGGHDRSVERDEDGECGGRAMRGKDANVGAVVGECMLLAVVALDEELNKSGL